MTNKIYKYIPVLMLVLAFTFNSCSEDGDSDLLSKNINTEVKELYNQIIEIDDLNEQKITVSSFGVETQQSLWQLKLDNFIDNNELSDNQIDFVNKLKNQLSVENLSKVEDDNVRNIASSLLRESEELFGKEVGNYLLNKFENINQTLQKMEINEYSFDQKNTNLRACNCERGDCYRLTGIGLDGFSWEYGECGGSCYVERYFFGLWESDNTGRCSY